MNYISYIIPAYSIAGFILLSLAIISWLGLKKSEAELRHFKTSSSVIPAKAGIHSDAIQTATNMDSRLRGNDNKVK